MKIKLALLIDVLKNISGGAEKQIYELIRMINKDEFEVALFILHHKEIPEEIKKLTNNVTGLGIKKIYGFNGIRQGINFCRFLKQNKVNILMTYHFGSDVWGTLFGKLAKVNVIISNRRDEGFWKKSIHILIYRFINRWVNKIVAVSDGVKKAVLETEEVLPDKVKVIYNGVDLDRFNTATVMNNEKRIEFGINLKDKIIGYVGNFHPIKGHNDLITSFIFVLEKIPNSHLLFIGEGSLQHELELKIKELKLNKHFHFLGRREDIPELLDLIDICVMPSRSEGLSNALLEYMAKGKPIIATSVGGNKELINDGINGLLVPPADISALAEKIILLLEDNELASKLGTKAKETAIESFNIKKQICSIENFLKNQLVPKKNKKELRVMHLISSNGLFGAEKVMLNLASEFNKNSSYALVVGIKNSHNPHLEVVEEAIRMGIPASVVVSSNRFSLNPILQLCHIVKKSRINIIHSHNYKANFFGLLTARFSRIPIIATNHLWTHANLKLRIYEAFDAFILRSYIDKVIAVSESISEEMIRNGIPTKKIAIIPNGINTTNNTNQINNIDHSWIKIGTIARLSPEKGHTYLFEAAKDVLLNQSEVRFLIVGNGPLENDLYNLTKKLNIEEKVIFTGFKKNIEDIYSEIDIIVQPSLREGMPLSILEAMSCGKPVIATDVGGVSKLIRNGSTGILVSPKSSKELSAAITKLINDKEYRIKLGKNAQEFVKNNFSLEKMANEYTRIYNTALNQQTNNL